MRNIIRVTLAVLFFSPLGVKAQELCGFEQRHQALLQQDAAYRQHIALDKINWSQFAKLKAMERVIVNGFDTLYEIPLVFHIVHTGGAIGSVHNPSDAQIEALVDFTNDIFQAQWPAYPGVGNGGTRVPFKFVLAKRDVDCNPTNGIIRVDASGIPDYVSDGVGAGGITDVALKDLSRWPNDQYYNVWVVNYIDGPGGGTAGYAYYPGAGPAVDGTVILATSSVSGSSTLGHEIGHGMGLPHTFEGDNNDTVCPPNNDCTVDGDGICDTEPHRRSVGCATTINPCTNQPMNFTQHSFMSYSHGCRDRFTPGQRDRMIYRLRNSRNTLMHSMGAVAPPPAPSAPVCAPISLNPTSTQNAGPSEVVFSTISNSSDGFTADGVFVDYFCTQRAEVIAGDTYPIAIRTGFYPEHVSVYIDYNDNGSFDLPDELVFTSAGTSVNQLHTGSITIPATVPIVCQPLRMRVVSDISATGFPDACGGLQHGQAEDYVVIVKPPSGAELDIAPVTTFPVCKDSLVSFGSSTVAVPPGTVITWYLNDVPVTQGSSYHTDSLQPGDQVRAITTVINPVCGTPDSIRSDVFTGTQLPPALPQPFISLLGNMLVSNITPIQWYLNDAPIPGATSQSYHPVQDGSYHARTHILPCPSDPSNMLQVSLLSVGEYAMSRVRIYPNPAQYELMIDWGSEIADVSVAIYNPLGQLMLQTEVVRQAKKTIPLQGLANGIYFLRITDRDGRTGIARIQVLH